MLFILHTEPVAFSADSKLVRNSVLLLPETLDIQVVTTSSLSSRESQAESGKSTQKMVRESVS